MATKQAWLDRNNLLELCRKLQTYLRGYKGIFEEFESSKEEILDDVTRKVDLKRLIDEDPDWTMKDIQDKYQGFKEIYEYLKSRE